MTVTPSAAHRAAAALRTALTDAAQLADDAVTRADADVAFDLVVAFDEALAPAPTFARALAALVAAGRPGELVATELARCTALLEQRGREVASFTRELAALEATEKQIRARAEEAERLAREVAELRRLEALAADLEELRAAHVALGRAGGDALRAAGLEEEAVTAAARSALEAVEQVSGPLRGEVRAELARLAESAAGLPRLRAELATATADLARDQAEADRLEADIRAAAQRHEEIRARLAELVSGWQTHLAADRDIAAVLLPGAPADAATGRSPAEAVEEITTQVGAHLGRLDGLLRALLVAAEEREAHDHRRRRMGEQPGASPAGSRSPSAVPGPPPGGGPS